MQEEVEERFGRWPPGGFYSHGRNYVVPVALDVFQ
jgi:hypothetical protein